MSKRKENEDKTLELVIVRRNRKTSEITGKISKKFNNGNDMYHWAQKMCPQWKYE